MVRHPPQICPAGLPRRAARWGDAQRHALLRSAVTPFIRLLVKTVRTIRAAGLPREPRDHAPQAGGDWEELGRDLGKAVRRFRKGQASERD